MEHRSFLGFDEEVAACREAFAWDLRDKHEVARRHWGKLAGAGGLGDAMEARLLFLAAATVSPGATEQARFPAECFEALRVGAQALDASEGFEGPAAAGLSQGAARFLGDWLVPVVIRRALAGGTADLVPTLLQVVEELAVGRNIERAYRQREQPGSFDSVSLRILYGAVEAKYARPARLATMTGAVIAGATEASARSFGQIGEAAGMAFGYLAVLVEGWDREVQEQRSLRRHHIRSARDAVRQMEAGFFIMRSQASYDLAPWERLAETLLTHLEDLDSKLEGATMSEISGDRTEDASKEQPDPPGKWESPIIPPVDGEQSQEEPGSDDSGEEKWEAPIVPPIDS